MKISGQNQQITGSQITPKKETVVKKKQPESVKDSVNISSEKEVKVPGKAEILKQSKSTEIKDPFTSDKKTFTDDDAKAAIQYFIDHGMENGTKAGFFKKILFFHKKVSDAGAVLDRIKNNKPVYLKNERNEYSKVDNMDTLQVLDSLKGRGENTILKQDEFNALKYLEQGTGETGGIYNPGFWGETKLNSYDAYMEMRDGETLQIDVGEQKDLEAKNLRNLAEVNALYGEGNNTILPQNQFDALKTLEKGKDDNDGFYIQGEKVNAYQALQQVKTGENVGINIGKKANLMAKSSQDFAEANAFYGDGNNTIMPDEDFQLFQYFEKGKDGDDGFYINNEKTDAYGALQQFQAGSSVNLSIGDKSGLRAREAEDLKEAKAFYGDGVNTILPDKQFDSMKYFDWQGSFKTPSGNQSNAFNAFQAMQSGEPAFIQHNGITERVYTPEDIHELDSLEASGINTILPKDQFNNLQNVKPYLCDDKVASGSKMSAYGALQKFQKGEKVDYRMKGGDFDRALFGEIDNIDEIPEALTKLDNQQEYDKYRFSVPEFKDKTQKLMKKTPKIVENEIDESRTEILQSESDIRTEKNNIQDAKHRIDRYENDLDDAEDDLRRARWMDDYVYEYGYHYGYNPATSKHEYFYGRHRVENEEKDRKIREARSDIDEAKRKIRRAESDKSRAQRALRQAEADLETAQNRLAAGEDISSLLPALQSLISSITGDNFASLQSDLKAKLSILNEKAQPSGRELRNNLEDCQTLNNVMSERPERPDGWVPPTPLLENYDA